MAYPTKKEQEVWEACLKYVQKAKDDGMVSADCVADGPTGHLAVAISNLLDAASSELFEDDEVRAILRCAKKILDLGM